MDYESRFVWIVFKRHINHWDVNEVMGVYLTTDKAEKMRQYYSDADEDENSFYRKKGMRCSDDLPHPTKQSWAIHAGDLCVP